MTTALEKVFQTLTADSAVTALVGQNIEPLEVTPGTAPPYIVTDTVVTRPFNHLGGWAGLDLCEVSVEAWATSYTAAKAVADQCRKTLEAAGFTCLRQLDDTADNDISPGLESSGYVFHVFQ